MSRTVLRPVQCTLQELKERGDRAITQGIEAIRILRIVTGESRELRRRIDFIHHQEPWSFEANLSCFLAQRTPSRV